MTRLGVFRLVLPLLLSACISSDDGGDARPLADVLSRSLAVQRVVDDGVATPAGCVRFGVLQRDDRPLVVNLLVDLDRSGTWNAHAVGAETQSEWLVRNLSLPALAGDYCAWSTLLETPSAVTARCIVSGTVLEEATLTAGDYPEGVVFFEVVLNVTDLAIVSEAHPAEDYVGGGGRLLSVDRDAIATAAGEAPVAPSDETTPTGLVRRGLTVTPQGPNTCVMHAMAASMAWLARKHGFTGRFKDEDGNDLYDVSTADGVNDMAYDLNDVGAMDWSPDKGIAPAKILPGKQAFVGQRKLPLETRVIDAGPGVDLFGEMKQALTDGCDVEIILGFPDVRLNHMVVAAGFSESGGARSLVVRNPDSPNASDVYALKPDGTLENFHFAGAPRQPIFGRLYIECYKAPSQTGFLGVSPSGLEFAHVPGEDGCPQEAGVLALTNSGAETAWWSVSAGGRPEVTLTPRSGQLGPGGSSSVTVLYNCGGGGASFSLPVRLVAGTGSGTTVSRDITIAGTLTGGDTLTKSAELTPLTGATVGRTITISHPVPRNARVLSHELIDDATDLPPKAGPDQPFRDHTWSILSETREPASASHDFQTIQFRYERFALVDHVAPAKSWSYVVRYAAP
jgi:hypothetical protein